MKAKFCVLFDMDGVILDTETQYNKLFHHIGDKYNSGIENFEKVIKGTTLPNIISRYFSHLSDAEKKSLENEVHAFEKNMDYTKEIKGSFAFVRMLKDNGIKVGLVTSSDDTKMASVYEQNDVRKIFDVVVTANRITIGKPDPMCFLLAAQDLGYEPKDCFVFEDSFAGVEAGKRAGMKVIALDTTHSAELLKEKCDIEDIISDFSQLTLQDLEDRYNS